MLGLAIAFVVGFLAGVMFMAIFQSAKPADDVMERGGYNPPPPDTPSQKKQPPQPWPEPPPPNRH